MNIVIYSDSRLSGRGGMEVALAESEKHVCLFVQGALENRWQLTLLCPENKVNPADAIEPSVLTQVHSQLAMINIDSRRRVV